VSPELSEIAFVGSALKAARSSERAGPLVERAAEGGWDHQSYRAAVSSEEVDARTTLGGRHRVKAACFRASKTLDDFVRPLGIPDWRPLEFPRDGHENSPRTATEFPGSQLASGTTPLPEVASMRRTESPSVTMTWAWCKSRSTRAEAMVLSMSWSKPLGCRFEERATERRS
jgi:hypothetical protein